jgi:hypothetical protein
MSIAKTPELCSSCQGRGTHRTNGRLDFATVAEMKAWRRANRGAHLSIETDTEAPQ